MGYNLGRILSYMLAGAIMASLGQIAFSQMKLPMAGLKLLSGIMMILMALSLAKIGNTLLWLEKAGSHIWKRLQPLSRRFFPVTGFGQALGVWRGMGLAALWPGVHHTDLEPECRLGCARGADHVGIWSGYPAHVVVTRLNR